jgi:signal transduction histidine kinase
MAIDATTAALLEAAVHDLKGPASRLRLLVQLLGRGSALWDDDTKTLFRHIEDSAAAVGAVAEGLKNYADICTRAVRREPVDLNTAVAAAAAGLQSEMTAIHARLEYRNLPAIDADPFLLSWLLRELLTNAIRFRGNAVPLVRISADGEIVAVADNGTGIEPALAARAFLPFKKLAPNGGAGLGLTICRKIAELHGGAVWVEPAARGADIRFRLGGGLA